MTFQKIVLVVPLCISMTSQAALSANKAPSKRNTFDASLSWVKGAITSQGTSPGDSARGQIESEENGVLRLNTTPCKKVGKPTVFRTPYEKKEAGEAVCKKGFLGIGRKTVKIYLVTQRG
jgi:hypothetical protein